MNELRRAGLNTMARQVDTQRTRRSSQTVGTQYAGGQAVEGSTQTVDLAPGSFLAKTPNGALYGKVDPPLQVSAGKIRMAQADDSGAPSFSSVADAEAWCGRLRDNLRSVGLVL